MMPDVDRAMGRIEGVQGQILAELKAMREEFGKHREDDQLNFSSVRATVYEQRDVLAAKIDRLEHERDVARGAGKIIVSLFSAMCVFVGSAVIAVFGGWVKFHS